MESCRPPSSTCVGNDFFEPLVAKLVGFDTRAVDPMWLRETLQKGLVRDEDIEKRFPKFVLSLMNRRDIASRTAVMEEGFESTAIGMSENFAVLWALSNVHVPALKKWLEKYDDTTQTAEPERDVTSEPVPNTK